MTNKSKAQIGGNHYNTKLQHVDVMVANNFDYLDSQVMKYMWRHQSKNGAEDVMKAIHYCLFNLKYKYGAINDDGIDSIMSQLEEHRDAMFSGVEPETEEEYEDFWQGMLSNKDNWNIKL